MRLIRQGKALCPVLALAFAGGCARQPPTESTPGNQNPPSGKRLKVSLTFSQPINPNYYYFFVINKGNKTGGPSPTGDQFSPGPIPVGAPLSGTSYGNGFATGSSPGTSGFTDFVLYSNPANQYVNSQQSNGYALYHIASDPTNVNGAANNRLNFRSNGYPITTTAPASSPDDPNSRRLYFEIDLSQLVTDTTDQTQIVNEARNTQWLQVNIIATDLVPTDIQLSAAKQFDSLGNDADGRGNYLTINVLSNLTIMNGDTTSMNQNVTEPAQNDIFVSPVGSERQDPALDLVDWSVQVTGS